MKNTDEQINVRTSFKIIIAMTVIAVAFLYHTRTVGAVRAKALSVSVIDYEVIEQTGAYEDLRFLNINKVVYASGTYWLELESDMNEINYIKVKDLDKGLYCVPPYVMYVLEDGLKD